MNHLAGVPGVEVSPSTIVVDEEEAQQLAAFRKEYVAHAGAGVSMVPSFEQSPDALPESGWRPLDDVTLLRFLRADKRGKKFNASASAARLHLALRWRRQMRSDELIAKPPPDHDRFRRLRVRRWVGTDYQGRPVQFERLGQFVASGNTKAFTQAEWLQHYARDLEEIFIEMRNSATTRSEPSERTRQQRATILRRYLAHCRASDTVPATPVTAVTAPSNLSRVLAVTTYVYIADLAGMGGIVRHMGSVLPLFKFLTKEVDRASRHTTAHHTAH